MGFEHVLLSERTCHLAGMCPVCALEQGALMIRHIMWQSGHRLPEPGHANAQRACQRASDVSMSQAAEARGQACENVERYYELRPTNSLATHSVSQLVQRRRPSLMNEMRDIDAFAAPAQLSTWRPLGHEAH